MMADQRGGVVVAERGGELPRPRARRSNRLKLKAVATSRNVPQDINSEDGLAIVSILAEARMIDIDQEERLIVFNFSRLTNYEVNDEGRIVSLSLGLYKADYWFLSEAILKLRSLKELGLTNCGQIPFTFNFPKLRTLLFINSGDEVLKNAHVWNGIKSTLKIFGIGHPEFASDNISSLITSVANFPHLKNLMLSHSGKSGDDMDPLLHQLQQNGPSFNNNRDLHIITLAYSNLTQDHLVTILCDILPIYDHILELDIRGNRIQSLQILADRIIDMPSHSSCFNTITKLNLTGNPVLEKLRDNNNNNNNNNIDERVALLTILSRFKRIHSIGIENPTSISSYGPEIETALRFNHAGRILVEGNNNNVDHSHGDGDDDVTKGEDGDKKGQQGPRSSNNGTQNNSIVPLSVWSKILERSYKKSPPTAATSTSTSTSTSTVLNNNDTGESTNKDATGLYYLVRNGPIIGAIVASRQRQRQRHVVDDKYKYDNGLQEETEGKKRKRTSSLSSSSSSSSSKSYPLKRRQSRRRK